MRMFRTAIGFFIVVFSLSSLSLLSYQFWFLLIIDFAETESLTVSTRISLYIIMTVMIAVVI